MLARMTLLVLLALLALLQLPMMRARLAPVVLMALLMLLAGREIRGLSGLRADLCMNIGRVVGCRVELVRK